MSFLLTSLAKIAVGALAGGAIIPTAYSLSKGEAKQHSQTKHPEKQNKEKCWTFVEGTDKEGDESRRLLVCTNPDVSHKPFAYYLYIKK